MTEYIKPNCMPFFYKNGKKIYKDSVEQNIAYTSDGFLLPCCWCDAPSTRKDLENMNMYADNLKLQNCSSVDEIVESTIWENFVYTILHDFKNAPRCCKQKCGYDD